MAVDWTKPIQCCYDGVIRPARYLGQIKTKHCRGDRLVAVDHGDYETVIWTSDDGYANEFRIVTNVPQKHVRWVNWYGVDPCGVAHRSREAADEAAKKATGSTRIACIRVEFEEGEGL